MIKTFDYLSSLGEIKAEVREAIDRVINSGQLILGPETKAFEEEFARFVGSEYCVAVSSGTSALHLAFMALGLGPGDEVITVSNTCVPTVAAIRLVGATPVFADVNEFDLMMNPDEVQKAITSKTRCILPVHLWGRAVDMAHLGEILSGLDISIVEDCAQAHGTTFRKKHVGTFGKMGCFSFYPTKNLGAFGDAGAVVTNDRDLAEKLRRLRTYGYDDNSVSHAEGMNARIGEIQAAILRVKLKVLPEWLARRRYVAKIYHRTVQNEAVRLPPEQPSTEPSYHQFVIRCENRQFVLNQLDAEGIGFGIHYPMPVHLMPAYRFIGNTRLNLPVTVSASGSILSLPIHEGISRANAQRVAEVLSDMKAR